MEFRGDLEEVDEENNLYSLFVSEEYVTKTFTFKDDDQVLLCSGMSSTDHDLTGQIVWPASVLLTWFLHHHIHQESNPFESKDILELGAGCGLAGFYLACHGKTSNVTLTDGNDIVCRLLKKNREFLRFSEEISSEFMAIERGPRSATVNVRKLLWGVHSEMRSFWENRNHCYPDFLIGADIILWPNQIKPLLYTIRWSLFARLSTSSGSIVPHAYVSYVIRANSTTELFMKTASEMGLDIDIIPRESFLPKDCRTFDNMETRLFDITLGQDAIKKGCDFLGDEEANDILEQMVHNAMPC